MKKNANEAGFTFLEMCIVIAIIGVLMMIAIPNYRDGAIKAQEKSCEANRDFLAKQIELYYIDQHEYPVADTDGTEENETISNLITAHYLRDAPQCPSKGTYKVTWDANSDAITVECSAHPSN